MDPVHRTRDLLSGNGDLRSEQNRKMVFCIFKKIRLIWIRTLSTYLCFVLSF